MLSTLFQSHLTKYLGTQSAFNPLSASVVCPHIETLEHSRKSESTRESLQLSAGTRALRGMGT